MMDPHAQLLMQQQQQQHQAAAAAQQQYFASFNEEQKAHFMMQFAAQQQQQHQAAQAAQFHLSAEDQAALQAKAQMEAMMQQSPMIAMMSNPAYQVAYRTALQQQQQQQSTTATVQQIQQQAYVIQQQLAAVVAQSQGQPNEQQQVQMHQLQQSLAYLQQLAQQTVSSQVSSYPLPASNAAMMALVMNNDDNLVGQSCHQCKTRRAVSDLYFCNTTAKKNKQKRKRKRQLCRKKYCCRCLLENDSRVLTNKGWMFLDQIEAYLQQANCTKDELKYACYESTTASIVYCNGSLTHAPNPEYIVDFTSDEIQSVWQDEVHASSTTPLSTSTSSSSSNLSIRVTPQHEMYVQLDHSSDYRKIEASEFARLQTQSTSKDVIRMISAAENGVHHPAVGDEDEHSPVHRLQLTTPQQLEAFLRLYGAWLANGSIQYELDSPSAVTIQSSSSSLIQACTALQLQFLMSPITGICITDAKWISFFDEEYWSLTMEGCTHRGFQSTACAEALHPFASTHVGRSLELQSQGVSDPHSKWMLPFCMNRLDKTQARVLLDPMQQSTGFICVSSITLRDQLMQLALHAGYSCYFTEDSATTQWNIHLHENTESQLALKDIKADKSELTSYDATRDGRAWCVAVDHPDHLIIVQRARKATLKSMPATDATSQSTHVVTQASTPIVVGNCLIKFYSELPPRKPTDGGPIEWSCPGCRNLCSCAACRRARENPSGLKKGYSQDGSLSPSLYPGGKQLDPQAAHSLLMAMDESGHFKAELAATAQAQIAQYQAAAAAAAAQSQALLVQAAAAQVQQQQSSASGRIALAGEDEDEDEEEDDANDEHDNGNGDEHHHHDSQQRKQRLSQQGSSSSQPPAAESHEAHQLPPTDASGLPTHPLPDVNHPHDEPASSASHPQTVLGADVIVEDMPPIAAEPESEAGATADASHLSVAAHETTGGNEPHLRSDNEEDDDEHESEDEDGQGNKKKRKSDHSEF